MNCWFCQGELIWGGDHDAKECGYDGSGIVTNLTCGFCGAHWEGVLLEEYDE